MEFTAAATAAFSASHVVKGHPRCGRDHGHRWRVQVEIKAVQDPASGELVGLPELASAVEVFADELHRERINDMLPGIQPTSAGICLVLKERLALHFPTIVSVTVWADDERAMLHG